MTIHAGRQGTTSNSQYLRSAGRTDFGPSFGTPMMRSGSIVGLSLCADIIVTVAGTLTIDVRVNNTVVLSILSGTLSSNQILKLTTTQDRGIDTFAVDDLIQLFATHSGGISNFSYQPVAFVELEFDQ